MEVSQVLWLLSAACTLPVWSTVIQKHAFYCHLGNKNVQNFAPPKSIMSLHMDCPYLGAFAIVTFSLCFKNDAWCPILLLLSAMVSVSHDFHPPPTTPHSHPNLPPPSLSDPLGTNSLPSSKVIENLIVNIPWD